MNQRQRIVAIATTLAVIAGGAIAFVALGDDSPDPASSATKWGNSADGVLSIRTKPDALKVRRPVVKNGGVLVDIKVPSSATEMQVTTDATMTDASWQDVAPTTTITVHDVGYQMIFARFRDASNSVSPISVVGVDLDPTFEAAISNPRVPSVVGTAAANIIEVTIENGRVEIGGLGRDDRLLGFIDGLPELGDAPWSVTSVNDPNYAAAVRTTEVHRVTRSNGAGSEGKTPLLPVIHRFLLVLPTDLRVDSSYSIAPPGAAVPPFDFDYTADSPSSSVHVNQVGFDPSDPIKMGHLSGWMGDGGGIEFESGLGFAVLAADDTEVLRGTAERRPIPADGELGRGDLTGAEVWELDFSELNETGRFRLCVDTVGCSDAFDVEPGAWRRLSVGVARAMYHQRSGTDIGAPYTAVTRTGAHTKKSAPKFAQSTYTLFESQTAVGDEVFQKLVAGRTDTMVPDAWGGHFDAGDWDRRIQHLFYVRSAIDLVRTYPDTFAKMNLDIPESDNKLPDILDEALWSLDLYRRLQQPDGGIRGGIEANGHPESDAASWTDPSEWFVYAPDAWSSYIYAATAAQMSAAIAPYDPDQASMYSESALRAMSWADAHPENGPDRERVTAQRATAAASLLALTRDKKWEKVFEETTPFATETVENLACHSNELCDAAWEYARIDASLTKAGVRDNIIASFRSTGDNILEAASTTAFGWTLEHPANPLIWGLGVGGTPKTLGLLRAYRLTQDRRYLIASYRSASVSAGDNPSNTSFITGFGSRPVRDPLIVDSFEANIPVWPGTPVYGNHTLSGEQEWVQRFFLSPAGVTPGGFDVPYLWSNFDVHNVAPMSEYTVYQSHGPSLFAFGALAGEADLGK